MPAPKDPKKRALWIERLSKSHIGKKQPPRSEEWCEKISIGLKGNKNRCGCKDSEETKLKKSKGRKGKSHTKKTRKVLSDNAIELWKDPEYRKKQENRIYTEEQRKANSERRKRWWSIPENKEKMREIIKELWQIPEYREKMVNAQIELNKDPEFRKEKSDRTKGFKHTNKAIEKISKAAKKMWENPEYREKIIAIRPGKDSPHWKGGISTELYGKEFNNKLKLQIRERDNFTCQECCHTEEELRYTLIVHHIDYNKKNNDPQNLISLCRSCHTQTNFGRDDWTEYFKEKVSNGST